ncbi:MAG: Ig-like domain-containing protein, partial [Lachnospiraceae bacterium]|nr:Ig-like domain-containing protein [Lachnospiraceae bacterium]
TCTLTNYNQSAKCTVKVRKLNSKVKFDKTNIRIGVGQTYTIKRTVWSNASTTPKLSWKTSNKRILTVNSSGKIKGIRVGLAKITAITKDKIHAKAVCNVRVIRRAKSIGLNTDYMVLYVGRSKTLTARFRPSNATVKKVKWTSGNSKIARVTGSGKVRGISVGDTYITATATDGSNKKAKCYVKVLEAVPATSIVVAQKDMTMKRGDSAKLSFTVLPSDTSDGLKFSSNNKRVATINSKGVVHAVGTGDAEITILTTSGITANVNINVVALNKKSIKMRQYDSETLTVFGAKNTVTWYSSNKRVATVDNNGLVVGKGKGTAYIYAYVNGCKLGCKVTITSVNS